jgi:hypothetical protein
MWNRLAVVTSALAVILAFSAVSRAQSSTPAEPEPHATTSQSQTASRDLSGVWNATSGVYGFASFSKDDPPMTPWGWERYKASKPSQGRRGVKLSETNDHVYKCAPPGMPYIYLQLFPMQIVQTPNEVIEMFEYDHTVRYIFVDGRQHHPADLTPTYNGHSIGHWDGDTLVVDTIGLNGKNWLDRVGHPESEKMHIVERIRRVDEKTLQVDLTFEDPKSYQKAWTAKVQFGLRPNWDILEHVCEDNLAFEGFEK